MADIPTLRTEEELDLINRMYGSDYMETKAFNLVRSAAKLEAQRRENVRLLKQFSDFCEEHGALWFVYDDTLRGVVSYQDFLPGSASITFGMPRADYQCMETAYRSLTDRERQELPWEFQPYFEGTRTRRIYAHVNSKHHARVKRGEDFVYGSNSMPLAVRGSFAVTVFDEVPDDFFTRKKFFRQMKRRNETFKRTIAIRAVPDGDEAGHDLVSKSGSSGRGTEWVGTALAPLYRLLPLRCASWGMHALAQRYQGRDTQMITRVSGWRSITLPKSDIGPTQWMPFAGIQVRCPMRPDIWAKEPIIETTPELRRLQEDAMAIVAEIDRVCHKLGIRYFACGGTMLGHVRHGGFIPWDDDIDIGMLREDYEIFKAKAGALIDSDRFFLQTRETDPTIPYLFSKVRMLNSTYITEYNKFRPFQKGICVDVFPFDYIPNGVSDQSAFKSEAIAASKEHNHIVNRQYPPAQWHEFPSDRKDMDYYIAQAVGRILAHYYTSIPLERTQAAYDEIVTRYDADHEALGLIFVASFVPSYTMAKVDDLFPTQRVHFDEIEVEIPRRPEVFLDMQYGDYQVMPYPHQRAGHDLLLWSDAEGIGGGREAENMDDTVQWG
ncbi:MAG: LicD family protein [Eggerthellaceae bacterium]|jgi:lipopolysaccharide cholinephosphotransferase